jgi:hypothetical protein
MAKIKVCVDKKEISKMNFNIAAYINRGIVKDTL